MPSTTTPTLKQLHDERVARTAATVSAAKAVMPSAQENVPLIPNDANSASSERPSETSRSTSSSSTTPFQFTDPAFDQHVASMSDDHLRERACFLFDSRNPNDSFECDLILTIYNPELVSRGMSEHPITPPQLEKLSDNAIFTAYGKLPDVLESVKRHQVTLATLIQEGDHESGNTRQNQINENENLLTRIQELECLSRIYQLEYKKRTGVDLSTGEANSNHPPQFTASTVRVPNTSFAATLSPREKEKSRHFLPDFLRKLLVSLMITAGLTYAGILPFVAALGLIPAFLVTTIAAFIMTSVLVDRLAKNNTPSNDIPLSQFPEGNSTRNIMNSTGAVPASSLQALPGHANSARPGYDTNQNDRGRTHSTIPYAVVDDSHILVDEREDFSSVNSSAMRFG